MTSNCNGKEAPASSAPMADAQLIEQARKEGLETGQPLSALFVKPSPKARSFLQGLTPRNRAALENTARTQE